MILFHDNISFEKKIENDGKRFFFGFSKFKSFSFPMDHSVVGDEDLRMMFGTL